MASSKEHTRKLYRLGLLEHLHGDKDDLAQDGGRTICDSKEVSTGGLPGE